jgi:uncharacterized repeat protein (TIGR03803 family)
VDGKIPVSSVIFDKVGNLYGTTSSGGMYGQGVVFELSPEGGSWTETVLHSFGGYLGDGISPRGDMIFDPAGNLYGTTAVGGNPSPGTVFEMSPFGGGWTEQVIYNELYGCYAGLTMDAAGNIFGASFSTVFELSPNGNGGWTSIVLHTFTGAPEDGSSAYGTPALDQAGNLYGTTYAGGAKNRGTVYKLNAGEWTEEILYSFKGGLKDGGNPFAGIVFDKAGNIYGTALSGGNSIGTVFELVAPVGAGSYKEKVLWGFNNTDGAFPYSSLTLDSARNLYGTTWQGGSADSAL